MGAHVVVALPNGRAVVAQWQGVGASPFKLLQPRQKTTSPVTLSYLWRRCCQARLPPTPLTARALSASRQGQTAADTGNTRRAAAAVQFHDYTSLLRWAHNQLPRSCGDLASSQLRIYQGDFCINQQCEGLATPVGLTATTAPPYPAAASTSPCLAPACRAPAAACLAADIPHNAKAGQLEQRPVKACQNGPCLVAVLRE
jgi:hypothetical protein